MPLGKIKRRKEDEAEGREVNKPAVARWDPRQLANAAIAIAAVSCSVLY